MSILSDRDYRAYFAGFLTAETAAQIQFLAIGWQVFVVSHSAFALGLVGLAIFLPGFVFVFLAGIVVDRYDRRGIAIIARFGDAICSAALCALLFAPFAGPAPYLVLAFVQGTVRAFANPAQRTLLVNIIPAERYSNAQALYVSAREMSLVLGPAAGGFLISLSPAAAFAACAAASLAAAAVLSTMRRLKTERATVIPDWRSFLAGISFIKVQPVIFGAISLDLFAVLFAGANALYPIYADTILHIGAVGLGLLRSSQAVGAALVAAYLSRYPPRRNVGALLLTIVSLYGVATIVFGLSRVLWLSLVALAFAGAFNVVSVVIRSALVQLNTPDGMRGRVSAIESIFTLSSSQLGAFESGTLAALIGTVPCVVAGGACAIVIAGLWGLIFPALRSADRLTWAITRAD